MMYGAFRAWVIKMLKKNEEEEHSPDSYKDGYKKALEDVMNYLDIPLDDKAWENW